jgi:hypothetical protein
MDNHILHAGLDMGPGEQTLPLRHWDCWRDCTCNIVTKLRA